MTAATSFSCEPDPEHPGWLRWPSFDPGRYNATVLGRLIVRAEDADHCRVRMVPRTMHANHVGRLHGGATLGFVDVALFCALQILRGVPAVGAVTLNLDSQFITAGEIDRPVDAVVEVLRETRRLAFLRGVVEQGETLVAAFAGTIRKSSAGTPA